MNRAVFVPLFILLFQWTAGGAEMRTWTSINGDTVEAAYVRHIGRKVELETADGRKINVPVKGLSDEDREFLASLVPPTINIDVDIKIDTDTIESGSRGYEAKRETLTCEVLVKKTNREPSNRKFTVYMYVLAKHLSRDSRWLISQSTEELSFADGNNRVLFTCPTAVVEFGESSQTEPRGYRYEGYLVIIDDENGEMVAMECDNEEIERRWRRIKGAEMYAQFDQYFHQMLTKRKHSY